MGNLVYLVETIGLEEILYSWLRIGREVDVEVQVETRLEEAFCTSRDVTYSSLFLSLPPSPSLIYFSSSIDSPLSSVA